MFVGRMGSNGFRVFGFYSPQLLLFQLSQPLLRILDFSNTKISVLPELDFESCAYFFGSTPPMYRKGAAGLNVSKRGVMMTQPALSYMVNWSILEGKSRTLRNIVSLKKKSLTCENGYFIK